MSQIFSVVCFSRILSEAASPGRRCFQPTLIPLNLTGLRRGLARKIFALSKAFFGELLQTLFYRVQSLISIHAFRRDRYLGSFADVRRHHIHDADCGTFLPIRHNRNFALEAHGTAHQFAHRSRVKPALVRNQYPPRLRLSCRLLHRFFALARLRLRILEKQNYPMSNAWIQKNLTDLQSVLLFKDSSASSYKEEAYPRLQKALDASPE